jgi:hypothetical protein
METRRRGRSAYGELQALRRLLPSAGAALVTQILTRNKAVRRKRMVHGDIIDRITCSFDFWSVCLPAQRLCRSPERRKLLHGFFWH